MKRNQKRRVVDNSPRLTRSDHGNNAKSDILYTPPIGKTGRNGGTSGGGDSALLQRLEKITNEINTMQTYPNQQNQPPNQNYPLQYNSQQQQHQQQMPQLSVPPGYPPSFMNASPRNVEYSNDSPTRHLNEMMNGGYPQQQQPQSQLQPQQHALSPQRQMQQKLSLSYQQQQPPHDGSGSMQPHGATSYSSASSQMEMADTHHMSLNMRSLQTSLAEAHEEHRRAMSRVELESNERHTLEQHNFELNHKLVEARQAVKDTQSALQTAQFATDQLTNKRSQRESYIKELSEVNTTNISRIATLEAKLKDAEDGLLEGNGRRDQFIHQIQSQLASSQEDIYGLQAEINTLNGQKCQAETELENMRARHLVTEQKLKDSENAIELTFKAKIAIMEDKNQSLMDKIAGEKHVYSQIQHLEEQLAHKNTALQRALESSKNSEMSLHEAIGKLRHQEEVLFGKDSDIQQLETKIVKYETEIKKEKQSSSQCKILEAEIGCKNTEIKLVNQSLHDTQTALDEAVLKIEYISRELNDKNKDLLDIDLKLKHAVKANMSDRGFNEMISSMQSEINDMESSLLDERSLKKRAEEDSETFQIKIRALEVNLRDKMAIIAEKESDVKNLQKLVNFDQVKSTQVDEMEEKLHELTHSLNIEVQAGRMTKRDLEKKDIKIQSLESALQIKSNTIVDLEDAAKNHNLKELSDRIMNKTIEQLELQLVERDSVVNGRNEKISALEKSLQEALGRIRGLETDSRDQDSELQNMLFKKQNAEREMIKFKTTCQSLEGKIGLFEKQNETLESRSKILIFEKHEASNKLEMLEKVVQEMAESTIDSASSVKEQHRLTEELRLANEQIANISAELEKSSLTINVLRKSLEDSDVQISKLSSESHSNHVVKKAAGFLMSNVKGGKDNNKKVVAEEEEEEVKGKEQKEKPHLSVVTDPDQLEEEVVQVPADKKPSDRAENRTPPPKAATTTAAALKKSSSSRKVITPAQSFMEEMNSRKVIAPSQSFMDDVGLSDVGSNKQQGEGHGRGTSSPPVTSFPISPRTMQNTMVNLESASGVMGKRHETTSNLAQITDLINSTTRDVEKITAKKKDMRVGIEAYTAEFKAKHNRQPTSEEKANAPDNIFSNYQQLAHILKKKTNKLAELEESFKKMQIENASS